MREALLMKRWHDILSVSHSQTHKTTETDTDTTTGQPQTMWLTLLTVVKLVELAGFGLALAEDQVVSDVAVGVVGRFPLKDDLGGRVGRGNGVQWD